MVYEYESVMVEAWAVAETANKYGKHEWRLVSAIPGSVSIMLIFERAKIFAKSERVN